MNAVLRQLRLRFTMPNQVLLIGTVMPKISSGKELNVEIAVYRKDFDAGDIVSTLVSESDFGAYKVRVLFQAV